MDLSSLSGHYRLWEAHWQMSGAVWVSLPQDKEPRRIWDGVWREGEWKQSQQTLPGLITYSSTIQSQGFFHKFLILPFCLFLSPNTLMCVSGTFLQAWGFCQMERRKDKGFIGWDNTQTHSFPVYISCSTNVYMSHISPLTLFGQVTSSFCPVTSI